MIDEQIEFEKFLQSDTFFNYPISEEIQPGLSQISLSSEKKDLNPSTSDYLVAFSTSSQSYSVGYVDIVNSTKISASLSSEKLSQYYEIFLNSMSKIIGRFNGKVIKNIGDCLLYYFPYSANSSVVGLKHSLDCGIAMVSAQPIIAKELRSKNLPELNYRISVDYGTVILMNTNVSDSVDLIGPPVNMCAKINHYARHNEFVIGHDMLHCSKKIPGYTFDEIKSCNVGFRYSYPVYRVTPR